jgi:hypothetical protein
MTVRRTRYVVIIGILAVGISCGRPAIEREPPSHKLTAIVIDSTCQDGKEYTVRVKSKGKADWYVVSECNNYDQKLVSIQFVDQNGNEIPPPSADGKCAKCSDKIKNNGFVKLSLDAKEVSRQETYDYVVWIGTDQNPHEQKLSDPRLEIDP